MRRVRYSVATSLDGYITDAEGWIDWILMDPDIDFAALTATFDTVLMGSKTYEEMAATRRGEARHTDVPVLPHFTTR